VEGSKFKFYIRSTASNSVTGVGAFTASALNMRMRSFPPAVLTPRALTVLCLCLGPKLCVAAAGSRFRGGNPEVSDRTVTAEAIQLSLRASLDAVMGGGDGAAAQQLSRIEASMWPTFQALPKNSLGRLVPRAVRYSVHNYFAKEHGWLLKGLEPHGMQLNTTEMHGVNILQDKAPALVEALLEAKRADHGLSFEDVVAMAAVLERLIFDESIALLESAYKLNGFSMTENVDEGSLHEVLRSYLLVFQIGMRANHSDMRKHQAIKAKMAKTSSWTTVVEFEQDAVLNFGFRHREKINPFAEPQFSFTAASQIVEDLASAYGKWQNMECRQMKEELKSLDPDGAGLVPLKAFYSQPETADYQFTESTDYLRKVGALDETGNTPRVRIANYLLGPSNCIASSSYYSICCLSDCEHLLNAIEGEVRAPAASPERLIGVVRNLTAIHGDAVRQLPQSLEEKLHAVGKRHGGEVPLHGRLFAQWMHLVFPSECPYPHIVEDTVVLTPGHWVASNTAIAPAEDRQQHAAVEEAEATAAISVLQWSDDEVLLLQEPPRQGRGVLSAAVRLAVQLALLSVVARTVVAALRTAASASGAHSCSGKEKGLPLPLRF